MQAEVAHQLESSSRLQNRMVGLASCIGKGRHDVIRLKVRKVAQNFFLRHALGQHSKNVRDADAHAANARPPPALLRLDCNAFQEFHALKMPENSIRIKLDDSNLTNKPRLCTTTFKRKAPGDRRLPKNY